MQIVRQVSCLSTQMFQLPKPPLALALGSGVMPVVSIENQILKAGCGLDEVVIGTLSRADRFDEFERAWGHMRADQKTLVTCIRAAFEAAHASKTTGMSDAGYSDLARLIARDYFGLVLTADVSTSLEDALIACRLPQTRWRALSIARYTTEELLAFVERPVPAIKIVKLCGDLDDLFAFSARELDDFGLKARPFLQQLLAMSALVVGYNGERDRWPFQPQGGKLHYLSASAIDPTWNVYAAIKQRRDARTSLEGPEVSLDDFWALIRHQLLGGEKPEHVGLQTLTDVGIPVKGMSEKAVESRLTSGKPIIEFLSELQEVGRVGPEGNLLVDIPVHVRLCIRYDNDQRLSFKIEGGGLSYESPQGEVVRFDTESLNHVMQLLGRNIAVYHEKGDKEGRDSWREWAKREGEQLYEKLFAGYPDLLQKFGMAHQAAGAGENLLFCFAGPRNHLGMPYELLCQAGPLAVRHPLFRQVTGVQTRGESFGDLLAALHRQKLPLRVLLISSNTGGIDADGEIRSVEEKIRQKADRLKVHLLIEHLSTEQACIATVKQHLTKCAYHVVHFAGHGYYDAATGEDSGLLFWSEEGKGGLVVRLTARALAETLRESQTALFYLSCCVGATVGAEHLLHANDYLGVMDALVQAGVPNVLGFRWKVTDSGAKRFAQAFYDALLETQSPPQAALQARRKIYEEDATDETWTSPILVAQNF